MQPALFNGSANFRHYKIKSQKKSYLCRKLYHIFNIIENYAYKTGEDGGIWTSA